ncbi:MAG: hypothetical protein ACI9G1_003403 [Pirellulaceae bacterium]|jgi:uncharacterized protein YjbI with pentapeptide repeats
MPNKTHADILKQGVEHWNRFRDQTNRERVDLSELDLNGAKLRGANLVRANLRGASLREAQLAETHLKGADLTGADITGANFEHTNARETTFDHVQGQGTRFLVATLRGASFRNADLRRSTFYRAYLRQTDFTAADLSGARLAKAQLERANLQDATLCNADLRSATLVRTNLDGADLTGAHVYGVGVWNASMRNATQQEMRISRTIAEPPLFVDSLNAAQLISLMVDNEDIRGLLNSLSSRIVLILGRFTEQRKQILDLIRDTIGVLGYAGVLFDFERPEKRSFIEVIKTLASISRFVIVDLTDPKVVHQEMDVILREFPSVPVRPILKHDHPVPVSLLDHAQRRALVLPIFRYRDSQHLLAEMEGQVIAPAEKRAKELEAMLTEFMDSAFLLSDEDREKELDS